LAIARALVMRPKVLVLDEPTEGIQPSIIKDIGNAIRYLRDQPSIVKEIGDAIRYLRDRGDIAILLVEQYFDFARELADSFAVMDRGQFVLTGDREAMQSEDVRRRISL
jgi:urea transport system ATP-binding protein